MRPLRADLVVGRLARRPQKYFTQARFAVESATYVIGIDIGIGIGIGISSVSASVSHWYRYRHLIGPKRDEALFAPDRKRRQQRWRKQP